MSSEARPLERLHDKKGRFKSPPIIFISTSKAEILSKSKLRLPTKYEYENIGLWITLTMSLLLCFEETGMHP